MKFELIIDDNLGIYVLEVNGVVVLDTVVQFDPSFVFCVYEHEVGGYFSVAEHYLLSASTTYDSVEILAVQIRVLTYDLMDYFDYTEQTRKLIAPIYAQHGVNLNT